MNLRKADLRAYGERIDKTCFLAAIGAISAGASVLLFMAVLLFPEWVSFHALAAESESDTTPVQVVTLRPLTAAPIAHAPKTQAWTTMEASQVHTSRSLQATTSVNIPPTAPQRPQAGIAGGSVFDTITRTVNTLGYSGGDSLLGGYFWISDLPGQEIGGLISLGIISSATSMGELAPTMASVTNQVTANNLPNGGSPAEAQSKVDDVAKDTRERAQEVRDLIEKIIR